MSSLPWFMISRFRVRKLSRSVGILNIFGEGPNPEESFALPVSMRQNTHEIWDETVSHHRAILRKNHGFNFGFS